MPTIAISFAETALREIEEIKDWDIKQEVPDVGEKFVAKIFQRVEDLADHPDIGRIVPKFGQPFLREIIHSPFRIVHRRDTDRVRVIRVWRSERLFRLAPEDN